MHPARLTSVRDVTRTVRRLTLQLEPTPPTFPPFAFRPGQWADFALPDPKSPIGGYSFVSAPRELPKIEFLVQRERLDESKKTTMTSWIHSEQCKPGVVVGLRAGGSWILPCGGPAADEDATRKTSVRNKTTTATASGDQLPEVDPQTTDSVSDVLFVAAGIGVTPFLSCFRELEELPHTRMDMEREKASTKATIRYHFFFVVRDDDDAKIFGPEDTSALQALKRTGTLASYELFQTGTEKRRPTAADIYLGTSRKRFFQDKAEQRSSCSSSLRVFLCGPPEFSLSIANQLKNEFGVTDVFYENWWNPNHMVH
ncbi:unnamed protein product [Amoebophrya sp. A120]|nr:unnamed protein product [Amoebophrya sp. A120]|eukprot:GSA120T00000244001.1